MLKMFVIINHSNTHSYADNKYIQCQIIKWMRLIFYLKKYLVSCLYPRKAAKNIIFSGPATETFFRASKKVIFFLSGQALTPLIPLSGQATKKMNFFEASPSLGN